MRCMLSMFVILVRIVLFDKNFFRVLCLLLDRRLVIKREFMVDLRFLILKEFLRNNFFLLNLLRFLCILRRIWLVFFGEKSLFR